MSLIRSGRVLRTLLFILVVLAVIVLVIGAIVLAIVRVAQRLDRRLGRLIRKAPRRSAARRSARASPRAAPRGASAPVAKGSASARPLPGAARPASPPPPGLSFRIRSAFEPKPEMRWLGEVATLRLHELAIAGPMSYVASDKRPSGAPLDPSEIIPSLPVDPRTPAAPATDPPSYAGFDPPQRRAYLQWLATGRVALPPDPAFLLVHFMGLERRALLEAAELAPLVKEVCRLRDLVARATTAAAPSESGSGSAAAPDARRHTSFMRQSASLLWMLVALRPWAFSERDLRVLASRTSVWTEEALVAALAWFVRRATPAAPSTPAAAPTVPAPDAAAPSAPPTIPAWVARVAAEQTPGARRSVVLERVPERFETLFDTRFAERHPPQGGAAAPVGAAGSAAEAERASGAMPLRVSKRERTLTYRPANSSLAAVECRVPDALAISSQFGPLVELWNACIDDLRPLARLGEGGAAAGESLTLDAWEALPADLRAAMDNPFAAALSALAAAHADESGHAIVTPADLCEGVRMGVGDRTTLTPTQSKRLAAAIAEAGMAVEPDARVWPGGYRLDAPVLLLSSPVPIDESGEGVARLVAASAVLRLGAAVALADGAAQEHELEPIAAELERAFDLSEQDHRRLDALLVLLRGHGSDVRAIGKRVRDALPSDARRGVGRLLVAVAIADGSIEERERSTLATCFRALGLPPSDLDAQIAALSPAAQTPAGAGGEGGAGAVTPALLTFDRDAIRAIMAETRQVAQLLADAMRADNDEQDEETGASSGSSPESAAGPALSPPTSVAATQTPLPGADSSPRAPAPAPPASSLQPDAVRAASPAPPGLAARYASFYAALLTRESWASPDAEALAREHRHMLSGAVEAINDWAFDAVGGPLLVDDGDRLLIDPDRRQLLARAGQTQ